MRLQNPLKQNPVKPDRKFRQAETVFKRYFAINQVFLVSDLGNTQETQKKHFYKASKACNLGFSRKFS